MEIQAAIGLVQLTKIQRFIEQRKELAKKVLILNKELCPSMKLIGEKYINDKNLIDSHSWMNIPFKVDSKYDAKKVMVLLEENGVETRPVIAGNLVEHPANDLIEFEAVDDLSNSNEILNHGFMIGCNPNTTNEELEVLKKAFQVIGKYFKENE